jgi:hypothetical protein
MRQALGASRHHRWTLRLSPVSCLHLQISDRQHPPRIHQVQRIECGLDRPHGLQRHG